MSLFGKNYARKCIAFWRYLHSWQQFCTTAGLLQLLRSIDSACGLWLYFLSPCKDTSAHRASSGRCRWHSGKVRHPPRSLGIGVKWRFTYNNFNMFTNHKSNLWQVFHVDFYLHLCLQKVWNLITGGAEVPFYWAWGVVGVPGAQH